MMEVPVLWMYFLLYPPEVLDTEDAKYRAALTQYIDRHSEAEVLEIIRFLRTVPYDQVCYEISSGTPAETLIIPRGWSDC